MKKFGGLIGLVFVGVLAYRLGDFVSHDVVTMAIGVLFGVMAGIPAALLMLASARRSQAEDVRRRDEVVRYAQPQPQQAPIIVLGGMPGQGYGAAQQPPQPQAPAWPTGGGGNYKMLGAADDEVTQRWGGR